MKSSRNDDLERKLVIRLLVGSKLIGYKTMRKGSLASLCISRRTRELAEIQLGFKLI